MKREMRRMVILFVLAVMTAGGAFAAGGQQGSEGQQGSAEETGNVYDRGRMRILYTLATKGEVL
jgi:hypothetical protein